MKLDGRLATKIRKHERVRENLRWALTRLNRHRPGEERDIAVFATARSGSTWLMEIIAAEPGMKPIYEPLRFDKLARAGLPTGLEGRVLPERRKIVHISSGDEDAFMRYFADERQTRVWSAGINRHGGGDGNALHRRGSDPRWPRVMR